MSSADKKMRGSSHYRNKGTTSTHQPNKVTPTQTVSTLLIVVWLVKNWSFYIPKTIAKCYNILKHNNLNYCTTKINKNIHLWL